MSAIVRPTSLELIAVKRQCITREAEVGDLPAKASQGSRVRPCGKEAGGHGEERRRSFILIVHQRRRQSHSIGRRTKSTPRPNEGRELWIEAIVTISVERLEIGSQMSQLMLGPLGWVSGFLETGPVPTFQYQAKRQWGQVSKWWSWVKALWKRRQEQVLWVGWFAWERRACWSV